MDYDDIPAMLRARADRRSRSIIDYTEDCGLDRVAADEIERLRDAANDLAQYVSRADWYHYVKPETRAALGEDK